MSIILGSPYAQAMKRNGRAAVPRESAAVWQSANTEPCPMASSTTSKAMRPRGERTEVIRIAANIYCSDGGGWVDWVVPPAMYRL